ncbi:transcription factor bHLH52-like [Aristolochia californica]|uniref:transcription factor bHLH52-like n=1 Tax=Aristolochia californica TaxID=171875 RepID=UPI0035DCE1E6
MINGFHQTEANLAGEFLCFCDSCGNASTRVEGFYEAEYRDPYAETNYSQLLSYFTPLDHLVEQEILRPQEFDFYHFPKRTRTCNDFWTADLQFNPFDGNAQSSCPPSKFTTGFLSSPPEFQLPVTFPTAGNEAPKQSQEACLSVQSVAARQRRKKISERTQGLGTLIPGGGKMNTAEMFQAAYKYVKFMQAQVALLQFLRSIQETQEYSADNLEGLHVLLCSAKIQEKLYEEGKCMVSKEFLRTLVKTKHLQSNPSISKDLECLL